MWNKIFRGGTKFSEKIVPGTKIFTENFVPPEQFFPDQNSSDSSLKTDLRKSLIGSLPNIRRGKVKIMIMLMVTQWLMMIDIGEIPERLIINHCVEDV